MNLKELYIELSSNPITYEKYCSIGHNNYGKIFSFISTNYRAILPKKGRALKGFAQGFKVLNNVCGIKRSNWARHFGTKQEIEKQHTVNMRKSELFFVSDDTYNKTSRGIVFEKMLSDSTLSYNEKNLLCYILICSGYFSDTPNYIFERTKEIFELYNISGYDDESALKVIKDFILKAQHNSNYDFFINHEYFILDSFYHDIDGINLLQNYFLAEKNEKMDLHNYICTNYKNRNYANKDNKCILSYKFKPSGVYTFNTLVCNAWILYVSKKIQECEIKNFDNFISNIIKLYGELFEILPERIKTFIYNPEKNRSVFQVIYCRIFHVSLPVFEVEKDLTIEEIKKYGKLDGTDEESSIVLNQISQSLKKLAKIKAEYKCEMEECEMCKYFTAKENHKPYLEIHHFIPKEFANDFDSSIEDISNYVALCPYCHRKIHLAEDSERKYLINKLYNDRKDRLKKAGLEVDIKSLYSYYKIDN